MGDKAKVRMPLDLVFCCLPILTGWFVNSSMVRVAVSEDDGMADLVSRPCGYCNGTGEADEGEFVPSYRVCRVCHGAKEVRVPSDYGVCRRCGGTGRIDVGEIFPHLVLCESCSGTGWAPALPTTDSNGSLPGSNR